MADDENLGDRREIPDRRRDSLSAQMARLETLIEGASDDIRDVKQATTDGLKMLDQRVRMLEDVRVRALEDWRTAERVLENERRGREREEQGERNRRQVSRRDLWLAAASTTLTSAVMIIAALITTGQL